MKIHQKDREYIEAHAALCDCGNARLRQATFYLSPASDLFLGTLFYFSEYIMDFMDVDKHWYWLPAGTNTPIHCETKLDALHMISTHTGRYMLYDCSLWLCMEQGTFVHTMK